jgi:hypothetical protein
MPSALGAAGVYDHDGRHRAGRDPDGCEVDSAPHSVSGNTKFRRPEYYHGQNRDSGKKQQRHARYRSRYWSWPGLTISPPTPDQRWSESGRVR